MIKETQVKEVLELAEKFEQSVTINFNINCNRFIRVFMSYIHMHDNVNCIVTNNKISLYDAASEKWYEYDTEDIVDITIDLF